MPDTGGNREIAALVNAKESETIQEQKKVLLPGRKAPSRDQARKLMPLPPPSEADATGDEGDIRVPRAKVPDRKRK